MPHERSSLIQFREDALALALEWANGQRSHWNEMLTSEPTHELGGPLNRPLTLAAIAQADAAEVAKWTALAAVLPPRKALA